MRRGLPGESLRLLFVGFTLEQVWRYPVKSLGGERVPSSPVDDRGLLGDRLWAVRDRDGKLGSGKNTRRFKRMEGLLGVTSRYPAEPAAGRVEPPVVTGTDGRDHLVASGAADEFLRGHIGLPHVSVLPESEVSHFDEVPLSLIGTATLDWLQGELPLLGVEPRRFRPNLVVRTREPFVEESWLGRVVQIGAGEDAVTAVFDRVLERCVMVGMAQPGLSASGAVLRRIAQRGDRPVCLALGGHVLRTGTVRTGDPVIVGVAA
jgi:MOSC domain-containing protein